MSDITYDIDELRTARTAVDNLITTLEECKNNLERDMQALKDAWKTDTGEKFFEEHKDVWTDYVNQYIKKINCVSDMLEKAIEYYEDINNEVAKLKV